MILALRNKKNNTFYLKSNSRIHVDEKTFFDMATERAHDATLFESIEAMEAHFEAKIQFIPLNMENAHVPKYVKKLIKDAKDFEIVSLRNPYSGGIIKSVKYDFQNIFSNILVFQLINHNFSQDVANFYMQLKNRNSLKKYIVSIYKQSELTITNLLGDDIEFSTNIGINRGRLLISTNRKTDINLLKLCFENSNIISVETKKFNSLV